MSSSVTSYHVICPKCGEENPGSLLHCTKCGASILGVPRTELPPTVSSQQTWFLRTLQTLGILLLAVPVLTANGFMFQVVQFKASLPAYQTLTIDWDIASRELLNSGLINLIGFPIVFYVAAALTFALARALGGKGQFVPHSYELAVAYLKVILAAAGVALLTLAIPAAQILNLGVLYLALKLVSGANARTHNISENRGCLAMIPLVLVQIAFIVALALIGPLMHK